MINQMSTALSSLKSEENSFNPAQFPKIRLEYYSKISEVNEFMDANGVQNMLRDKRICIEEAPAPSDPGVYLRFDVVTFATCEFLYITF